MNNEDGQVQGENASNIAIIFNPNQEETSVTIGDGEWDICATGLKAGNVSLGKVDGSNAFTVEPMSAMILAKGDTAIVAAGDDKGNGATGAGSDNSDNNGSKSDEAGSNGSGEVSGTMTNPGEVNKGLVAAGIVAGIALIGGILAAVFKKKK